MDLDARAVVSNRTFHELSHASSLARSRRARIGGQNLQPSQAHLL
jgi:hypothetical protein